MGPATEPRAREERKVITVLSADLVGSTALGARLDPEDAREIIGGALARAISVIEGLGGTIKDLAGDGVLAQFGAPIWRRGDRGEIADGNSDRVREPESAID